MGFHPNDKRLQVIRSKTHTTFFIFLLDKARLNMYNTICDILRSGRSGCSATDCCADSGGYGE